MKNDNETPVKDPYELTEGPLPKSTYTYQLEDITRQLLNNKMFSFTKKDNQDYISIGKKEYNWTDIINYANLDHIELNESDFQLYRKYLKTARHPSSLNPYNEILYRRALYDDYYLHNRRIPDPAIRIEEMQAINIYTGEFYKSMNDLLRNEFDFQSNNIFHTKDAIIQSVMCASGLRKIPQTSLKNAYRGGKMPSEKEFQERINAAETQGVIQLSGFVSSSIEKTPLFEDKPIAFHFTDLKGAYIAPISQNAYEKEFLIPPTQVQLTNYYVKNERHCFEGRLVSDLNYGSPRKLEIDESRNILEKTTSTSNPQFIHNVEVQSSHSFARVMEFLSQSQRDSLFNIMQKNNKLGRLIKNADDFIHVLMFLSPAQCNKVCEDIKSFLPEIICSEKILNDIQPYLLPDQLMGINQHTEKLKLIFTINNIITDFQIKAAAFINQSAHVPKLRPAVAEINMLSSHLNSSWLNKKTSQRDLDKLLNDNRLQTLINIDLNITGTTGIKSAPIIRELNYGFKALKKMVITDANKSRQENINTIKEMKTNLVQLKHELEQLSIQSNKTESGSSLKK